MDYSSRCQIKKVSKEKPLIFGLVPFFLRQIFDRSKTEFLMFCLFLLQTRILFHNHVVVSPFRLLTNGSKKFCGLTLFGREKKFLPLVLVTCLSL